MRPTLLARQVPCSMIALSANLAVNPAHIISIELEESPERPYESRLAVSLTNDRTWFSPYYIDHHHARARVAQIADGVA
jgi:hypothetical protein